MLEKLREKPLKIPAPSREEIVSMVYESMKNSRVDNVKSFKSLWLTNALDGSEDWKVSDKIMNLVGTRLKEFRQKLMAEKCAKNLEELLKQITPPKGLKRNYEGFEAYNCEGTVIQINNLIRKFNYFTPSKFEKFISITNPNQKFIKNILVNFELWHYNKL